MTPLLSLLLISLCLAINADHHHHLERKDYFDTLDSAILKGDEIMQGGRSSFKFRLPMFTKYESASSTIGSEAVRNFGTSTLGTVSERKLARSNIESKVENKLGKLSPPSIPKIKKQGPKQYKLKFFKNHFNPNQRGGGIMAPLPTICLRIAPKF